MENCLVTQLKGSVSTFLPKLGSIFFEVNEQEDVTYDANKWYVEVSMKSGKTGTVSADSNDLLEKPAGTPVNNVPIDSTNLYRFVYKNQNGKVIVEDNYELKELEMRCYAIEYFDITQLKYRGLSRFALRRFVNNQEFSFNDILSNVDNFNTLTRLTLASSSFNDTLEAVSSALLTHTNVIFVTLEDSHFTGDIEDFKDNINLELCGLNMAGVTGSIDNLLAYQAARRSAGNCEFVFGKLPTFGTTSNLPILNVQFDGNGGCIVKKKSDSSVLGSYDGSTWTYA